MATTLYNEELNSKALAHDIRGMLTTVQMAVDRLMLHEDRIVRTQCALVEKVIVKATEYCADAVCDSRSVKEESISSSVLVRDIDLILEPLAQAYGVDLNVVNIDFMIPLKIYKKLQRIIINLSRNAIVAQKNQLSAKLLILIDTQDREVRVDIIDNGPGISPKIMSELQEQLNSPKLRQKKALGMGLMSSYVYVEELGGHIDLVKTDMKGTQFRIHIPSKVKSEAKPLPALEFVA